MALEMKIYKEIAAYEPKPMFGLTWRQMAAIAFMVIFGGGVFAGVTIGLMALDQTMEQATTVAMYLLFPILIPAALWGWWRPKGLKPEEFLAFFFRHHLMRKTVIYDDTFRPTNRSDESVSSTPDESAEQSARDDARQRRAIHKALKKTVTEHAQPQTSRRKDRKTRSTKKS